MVAGVGALAGGMALVACGLTHSAVAIFLPRTVFAGAGSGMDFMGSMALLNQVGPPQRRAEVLSAYNIVSYVALSVPIVGGGDRGRWGCRGRARSSLPWLSRCPPSLSGPP